MVSSGKQYSSEGLFVLWILKPIVIIFNEEDMKNVLKNNLDKAAEYKLFHDVLKDGIFAADEQRWKQRRKMFNPLYRTGKINDKISIFNKHSKALVEELSQMDLTTVIEIAKPLNNFSFKVAIEAILGIDKELFASDLEHLLEVMEKCSEFFVHLITNPWLYFTRLFPEGRAFLTRLKKGNALAEKALMEMKELVLSRKVKEAPNECNLENKTSKDSLADVMLEHHVRNPDFTIEDMLTEIKSFFIAGYDTISVGLLWCLYLLGQHCDVQDCAYTEVKSLEGDLSFEDLQNLTYVECVIKESLRLFPPAPIFGRSLKNDTQLGRYKIPKGTSVAVNAFLYHRNPKIYSNPDKFDPDRFLDLNLEKSQWTFIAFSAGIRNCIGQKFAILEMKVVLAHILQKFKIISHDDYRHTQVSWEIMLKPDKPIYLNLIPRD